MFLLVSGRHVGAHLGGHQHGVSIQISINLGKTFPHISHKKICCDLNLGESLCISTFFLFPDSRPNLLNGFDFFILIYFEWRDTENQQLETAKPRKNSPKNDCQCQNFHLCTYSGNPILQPKKVYHLLHSLNYFLFYYFYNQTVSFCFYST